MDSMMVCGVCEADWPPGAVFCLVCSTSIAQAEPRSPADTPKEEDRDVPTTTPRPVEVEEHGDKPVLCARCGDTNPRGSLRCLSCFAPLGADLTVRRPAIALQFPWGLRRLQEGDRVLLGRDYESDVAGELRSFPDVSRRHAELRMRDGALVIRDLGSANGTFRNNDQLRPDVDELLGPGDQLRLGDTLVVRVTTPE